MRVAQVKTILSDIGLAVYDKWTRLPESLSEIQMANNAREYITSASLYKIDTSNDAILVSRGHKDEEVDSSADYTVDDVYYTQYIDAFVCSSAPGPYGSYYTRMF